MRSESWPPCYKFFRILTQQQPIPAISDLDRRQPGSRLSTHHQQALSGKLFPGTRFRLNHLHIPHFPRPCRIAAQQYGRPLWVVPYPVFCVDFQKSREGRTGKPYEYRQFHVTQIPGWAAPGGTAAHPLPGATGWAGPRPSPPIPKAASRYRENPLRKVPASRPRTPARQNLRCGR